MADPNGNGRDMRNDLGDGIRAQRERLGLSLRAVASEIGISASLLSQVETGKLTPSLSTLYEIASYLDVSVDALLGLRTGEDRAADADADALRASVQRAADNPRLDMTDGVTWERLAVRPDSGVEPVLVTYAAGASSSPDQKLIRHPGIEFGYILEGDLTLHLRFQQTVLHPGDSFSFDADTPHLFVNPTDAVARGIWYVAQPTLGDTEPAVAGAGSAGGKSDPLRVLRTSI
jgi:transcriptional regulator with XRE-family HTH domain